MSQEDKKFVWIKIEPNSVEIEATITDHEVEKVNSQTSHSYKMKPEPDWAIEDKEFDESVAQAGLYADHIIKEEVALGPEVIQQPKVAIPCPEYRAATSPTEPIWPKSTKNVIFTCQSCQKTFYQEDSLRRHVFAIHAKYEIPKTKMKKMHICMFCCQMFLSKNGLTEHLKIHFRESNKLQENVIFDKKLNVFSPEKTISMEPDNEYNTAHFTEVKDRFKKPYTCKECQETFVLQKCLEEHILDNHALPEYHDKVLYACKPCLKTFDSMESLTRHRFAIHTKHELNSCRSHEIDQDGVMRSCYFCCQWVDKEDLFKHMELHIEFASEIND